MNTTTTLRRSAALIAAALSLVAAPAAAQNGYSFLDAARSAVDYRVAPSSPRWPCANLRSLSEGEMTVIAAQSVPASESAPAFCRVVGVIAPEIQFEVALPATWNRRLYMRGNGGFAGESLEAPPRIAQRNAALRHGFVAAQTNTGHDAEAEPLATFASASLQKRIDYAFRAVHVTVEVAKRLTRAYYDRPVAFSYWDGCSTGGRQGLMSAQRFPSDFDGIIAGAPVLNFTDTVISFVWNSKALAAAPLGPDKVKLVADVVEKKCGGPDGLLDDPRRCDFDPARDLPVCAAGTDRADCVTREQIATLKAIYGGVVRGGTSYFPGTPIGAEKMGKPFLPGPSPVSGWDQWLTTATGKTRQVQYSESFLRHMRFAKPDPTYDPSTFDFDKDPARMDAIRALFDTRNPDLSEFRQRGGKLLMYWGWADTALTPYMGIDYYERVTATMGPSTPEFFRLFMVPGMFHCRGGFGPERFDALTALINWVEGGRAPDRIVASQTDGDAVTRTRPLCPYPQIARYESGNRADAATFVCRP